MVLDLVNRQFHSIISNNEFWKELCDKLNWKSKKDTSFKIIYFLHLKTHCIECGKKTKCYYPLWKFCVCKKCRFIKFYNKGHIKEKFNLKDSEINSIQHNKVRISNGEMYLFLKEDIHYYIKKTYGSLELKIEEKEKLDKEKKQKKEKKLKVNQQKKDELDKELRRVGIYSVDPLIYNIYEDYINGRRKSPLEKTVEDINNNTEIIKTTNFTELYHENTKDLYDLYQNSSISRYVAKEKYRKMILEKCKKK